MKTCVKLNMGNIKGIEKSIQAGLVRAGDAVRIDVQQSRTMPWRTGHLQNTSTFVDKNDAASGNVYVVSDTPYARRLYFHPELNFRKDKNPNAGAAWFDPYISGAKKDYAQKVFTAFLREKVGG